MTSTHVDMDSEMKNMVMCFRVSELQVLLGHAGRNKSGRKHELMSRALQLIRSSGSNKSIRAKVMDLYDKRFPNRPLVAEHNNFNGQSDNSHNNNIKSIVEEPEELKVQFTSLPFYELLYVVLPSYALLPNRLVKEERVHFQLSSHHIAEIRGGGKPGHDQKYKYLTRHTTLQIQLRFCILDSSREQSDQFPPNLSVKVNSISASLPPFIPPTKAGVEPKRPNQPINITTLCYASPYSKNAMDIRWTADHNKVYALTIQLVRQLTAENLLEVVKSRQFVSAESSKLKIRTKLAKDIDSDIATMSLEVSLLCPLGKMRMNFPARPSSCNHLQCFDAFLFLKMNERRPTWKCPVCDLPVDFADLHIDQLFITILKNCESEEITFKEDGSWHTNKNHSEPFVIGTPLKPIDLSHTGCKVVNEEQSKSKEPEVIDLTCDSSDDEDPPSPINVALSRSPLTLSDDTAMSISSSPIDLGSPSVGSKLLEVPATNFTPTSRKATTRSHAALQRSTPPYAPSPPYHRQYSPLLACRSPITQSPKAYTTSIPTSPKLQQPKSPESPNYNYPFYNKPLLSPYLANPPSQCTSKNPSPEISSSSRPPVISHSPSFLHSGVIETPQSRHMSSPLVTATPPGRLPHMELSSHPSNGFKTPPPPLHHLIANPTDPYLNLAPFAAAALAADPTYSSLHPFYDYLARTSYGLHPSISADLYARTLAQSQLSTATPVQQLDQVSPNCSGEELTQFSSDVIL